MEIQPSKNLVFKIVLDQDNFEGALREAVQNAQDSKTAKIEINACGYYLSIMDEGLGMNSREFKEFFLTLGDTSKDGETTLGKFGVGAGQLFGLGASLWYSKKKNCKEVLAFIDIRKNGLDIIKFDSLEDLESKIDYDLTLNLKGCEYTKQESKEHSFFNSDKLEDFLNKAKSMKTGTLNLIEREEYFSEYSLEREVSKIMNLTLIFPEVAIIYNNEKLSVKKEGFIEHPLFFYKLDSGSHGISIKERGNHVCSLDKYPALTGEFISKKALDLNITRQSLKETKRNKEFLSEIHKLVLKFILEKRKNALQSTDKIQIRCLIDSDYETFKDYKVFQNTSGKFFSIEDIKNSDKVLIAPNDSAIADKLNQRGYICIPKDLYDSLKKYKVKLHKDPFDKVAIKEKLCEREIEWSLIYYLNKRKHKTYVLRNLAAYKLLNDKIFNSRRVLKVCKSATSNGYTDGYYFIALNETIFQEKDYLSAFIKIKNVLNHEYTHKESSKGASHNYNFYENFHNSIINRFDALLAKPILEKTFNIKSSGQKQTYTYNFYTIKPKKLIEISGIKELITKGKKKVEKIDDAITTLFR